MKIKETERHMTHADQHEIVVPGPSSETHGAVGDGFWHTISARPGMSVSVFDAINQQNMSEIVHTEPCASLIYLFSARGESWMLDAQGQRSQTVPMRPGWLYFMYAPLLTKGVNEVPKGARIRGFDVRLSLDVWHRITGATPPCTFNADHPYHTASCGSSWVGILPVRPEQRVAAQELFDAALSKNEDLMVEARCLELINSSLKTLTTASAGRTALARDRDAVETVKQCIHAQLDHNWSVAELAQQAGITAKRLKQAFPSHVGLPVYKYVQEVRLSEAERLLAEGNHRITDVALTVGYASLSHFSVLFRRRFGMSPSQYADFSNSKRS